MKQILAINVGSSSLKLASFDSTTLQRVAGIELDLTQKRDPTSALREALDRIAIRPSDWIAIGHRIVHGGNLLGPRVVDVKLRTYLETLVPRAPLHQPAGLAMIDAAVREAPAATQIACFDTSFHRSMPDVARRYALPAELDEIEASGFHGLSYEYIASALPLELATGRLIVAHLGSGASMCAMRDRTSIACTMGFTPLDGLVMETRPGTLDPGIVLYLIEQRGMTASEVRDLLYHRSGLLGVSGISANMRDLVASTERRAVAAIELFEYRAKTAIGSLAASLGGLDTLVFTGGIGQHSTALCARIAEGCRWIGNFVTRSMATDEELQIARHASSCL